MFRAQRDPETMHGGPDHDLGLPGEQLDLAAGAAGAVVQLVERLRGQRYRVREPDGDVAAGGPPRHGIPIQHLTPTPGNNTGSSASTSSATSACPTTRPPGNSKRSPSN